MKTLFFYSAKVYFQDLNNLIRDIKALQTESRSTSTTSNKHVQSHSANVVVSLQSRLANISTDFKSVLDIRTEVRQIY